MSLQSQFADILGCFFRQSDREVLGSWDVSYAQASRIAHEGRFPDVTVTLRTDGASSLTFEQAWHLYAFKYHGEAEFVVYPHPNSASYQVLLLRKRSAT